ncbi:MAG: hypothetical protein HYS13_24730 [Planctomycetia bacterium]|nr:hypothetical protein [Planctomycetia bacterium]
MSAGDGASQLPLVLTVHGINSDGEWQDTVQRLLSPHFEFDAYRYYDFRYAGFVRQFIEPACCLLMVAVAFFWAIWLLGFLGFPGEIQPPGPSPAAEFAFLRWPWDAWASIWVVGVSAFFAMPGRRETTDTPFTGHKAGPRPNTYRLPVAAIGGLIGLSFGPWLLAALWLDIVGGCGLLLVLFSRLDDHPLAARSKGLVRLVLNTKSFLLPIGCVALAFCLSMAMWMMGGGAWAGWPLFWASVASLVILAAGGWWLAQRRYHRRAAEFLNWLNGHAELAKGRTVHVIAHSFGTWLTGEALRSGELKLEIRRLILVGCVLRRDFPWPKSTEPPVLVGKVQQVRNEVGGRDPVAAVIQWLESRGLSLRRFGSAGRLGFRRTSDLIHDVENSLDFCEVCVVPERHQVPRVHNVFLPTFRHSDAFAVEERTTRFWLPFLLELDSWEYWDFWRLCRQAGVYEEAVLQADRERKRLVQQFAERSNDLAMLASTRDPHHRNVEQQIQDLAIQRRDAETRLDEAQRVLDRVARQLADRQWAWTQYAQGHQVTLENWVARKLLDRLKAADTVATPQQVDAAQKLATRAIRSIWDLVCKADRRMAIRRSRRETHLSEDDRALLLTLDPRKAVARAVADMRI